MTNDDEPQFNGPQPRSARQSNGPQPRSDSRGEEALWQSASARWAAIDEQMLHLARDLQVAYERRYHQLKGGDAASFEDYAAAMTGIPEKERIRKLRDLYWKFVRYLKVPFESLRGIKIQSLLAVKEVAKHEDVEEWLKSARTMSTADLRRRIAETKTQAAAENPGLRRVEFSFKTYEGSHQADVGKKALAVLYNEGGHSPNEAFAHICMNFLMNRLISADRKVEDMGFFLRRLEDIFGGKVVWITSAEAAAYLTKCVDEAPGLFNAPPPPRSVPLNVLDLGKPAETSTANMSMSTDPVPF